MIEKNIPLPPARKPVFPAREMEVGDSYFIPVAGKVWLSPRSASIRSTASQWSKKLNRAFVVRHVEGGIRVWRTA